jgi:hypothetical protein
MVNTTENKRVIWQNYNIDVKDYQELFDEYEVTDEYEQYRLAYEENDRYLDDERANIAEELDENIIIIADIGLWDGRRIGYKEIGSNVADCLEFEKDCDYAEWYVDSKKNLRSSQSHHDGTHHLLYRVWKKNLSERAKENFRNLIYTGKVKPRDITKYTRRLGDYVNSVYGW